MTSKDCNSESDKPDGKERRATARHEMVLKVEYEQPGNLLADYLTDLGMGGLFICTSSSFEVGETIHLSLSFPGVLRPLRLSGVVRWRRQSGDAQGDRPAGVGVEFLHPHGEHRQELESLLARHGQAASADAAARAPLRVLLAEDNPHARHLFEHGIERFHRQYRGENIGTLELTSVSTVHEVLAFLERTPPDLAVVDFFLPGMHGADLVGKIRRIPAMRHKPLLVISVARPGVREEALRAGADFLLDKPVLLKPLLAILRMLMISHGTATAPRATGREIPHPEE